MSAQIADVQDVVILLFAAGSSRRMRGADKLMEPIDGMPIVRRQAQVALQTGAQVLALLPPDRPLRNAALAGLDLRQVLVEDADQGMSASLRAGLAALPDGCEAAIIMLADMPDIEADDINRLINTWREAPSRPARLSTPDGKPGSPVLFPARFFDDLALVEGDEGGRSVLKGQGVTLVPCADDRALIDLDSPEDWAAWRAKRAQ